jgi:hypothetical protein
MPTDAVPQILTRIQDSISALRAEVGEFRTSVEGRLDRLEQTTRKHRNDAAATMIIMRATVSHFNQRSTRLKIA